MQVILMQIWATAKGRWILSGVKAKGTEVFKDNALGKGQGEYGV